MDTFTVSEADAGARLDTWLSGRLSVSRSQLQQQVKQGAATVNGKKASPHYVIKPGDEVSFEAMADERIEPRTIRAKTLMPEIDVVAELPGYVIINKPAGLLMHPASETSDEPTVVDWLLGRYPKARNVGEDPLRPGIVHRLDREASGLAALATTQAAFDNLKEQFQKRTITKRYTALVFGGDMPESGEINFKIERSTQGGKMAARPLSQEGRSAVTEFSVVQRFHNYCLLSVVIKTGRTHQIRVHMSAYNHPIVGDDIYGGPKHRTLNKKFKLGRIFLVATELGFADLEGKRHDFSVSLPADLQEFLKQIK